MKREYMLGILVLMLLVSTSFVQAGIESIKDVYKTTETISVKSTESPLCGNLEKNSNVSLYIVENQDEWGVGDALEDVRGEPQIIPNAQFSTKKIWENAKGGFYDIIVDCVKNGEYDALEPLDAPLNGIGFTVEVVPGSASASLGENDVGDHIWRYDPEDPSLTNVMMQFQLLAGVEDIILDNITIQALGDGDDAEIDLLEIYVDENNNGELDEDEFMIGDSQPAYELNNGESVISLDYILTKDLSENFLIVYQMKETATEGKFSLKVTSLKGIGGDSEGIVSFTGLPLESGEKNVLDAKTCLGTLGFELDPVQVSTVGSTINAMISGLEGCDGYEIMLMTTPCGASVPKEVSSCVIEGEGCETNLTADATRAFYACLDKNEDGDVEDAGENARAVLTVGVPGGILEGNETEGNDTETGDGETGGEGAGEEGDSSITGNSIEEIKQKLAETGSFFILLEVTLLLILFVLVMIMFRLKPATTKVSDDEDSEEDEDSDDEDSDDKKKKK